MASSTASVSSTVPLVSSRSCVLGKINFTSSTCSCQLKLARCSAFPLQLREAQKGLSHHCSQSPYILPRIQCLRESKATAVTKDSWEKLILNSETPVLVEFFANWCGPCRMVHRVIDEIAEDYAGRLKCFVLNTDSDLQIAEDYEIKAVPVVLLFKNGKKCDTVVGTMPKEFYVTAIERLLKS